MLLKPRSAHREHAGAGEALVVAGVAVEGLARQRAADFRRDVVGKPHRAAGERPELAEDRRLLDERDAEGHERAVAEHLLAELLLLVLRRVVLERRIVVLSLQVDQPAGELDPADSG